MSSKECLVEWTINYLKNRDLLQRRIVAIEQNKDGFDVYVKYKDKEQFFLIRPVMGDVDEIFSKLEPDKCLGLVMFNTTGNFEIMIKNWKRFIDFKMLSVYFVNPESRLDKKWIIWPYTHNNICENGVLEKGLRSMFEMVEPVPEAAVKR